MAAALLRDLAGIESAQGRQEDAAELELKADLLDGGHKDRPAEAPEVPRRGAGKSRSIPESKSEAAQAAGYKKLLAQSYNDLGTAQARQGIYVAAANNFKEASRWDAPTPTLLRNLGTAAFRIEDFPTAARALGEYLRSLPPSGSPVDAHAQLLYGVSLFSLGDFAGAVRAFLPVAEDARPDARTAYAWAFSLAHSGDPKQANIVANELSKQALPPDVLSLVCHIFIDTENYEQGISCYRKILAIDPAFKLAHYQVAESLIRLDRPGEAIAELRQELALNPDDPNVQYSLAFALLQTSNKDEAFKLLRVITADHPEMAEPQYQFGKLLLEADDLPNAILHLELAEQADPSVDYIHYQLQAAYRKARRLADADREARLYKEIKAKRRDLPAAKQ